MEATTTTLTAEELKRLIDAAAGWAESWDDVVYYLRTVAVADTHLPEHVVALAAALVLDAKQHDVPFSTDYRVVWQHATGQSPDQLPPPETRSAPVTPMELKSVYLKGFGFPDEPGAIYAYAEERGAPWRVLQTIRQLPRRQYRDMDDLLDAVGDIAWDSHA